MISLPIALVVYLDLKEPIDPKRWLRDLIVIWLTKEGQTFEVQLEVRCNVRLNNDLPNHPPDFFGANSQSHKRTCLIHNAEASLLDRHVWFEKRSILRLSFMKRKRGPHFHISIRRGTQIIRTVWPSD